jgi:hypothetical protein
LEWIDEDSEAENFTLVVSKKKKKKKQSPMNVEKPVLVEPVRRSKRTAPSIYRNKGSLGAGKSCSQGEK